MRDIYAEAGLSPGAVYHYFASKDDIIAVSFTFDYQRSRPVFERVAQNPDPLAAIGELIDFFYTGLEYLPEEVERARRGRGMFNMPKKLSDTMSYWYINSLYSIFSFQHYLYTERYRAHFDGRRRQ